MAQTALAKEWVSSLAANNPHKETQSVVEQLKSLHEKKYVLAQIIAQIYYCNFI
jgi:hypothetical protein